MSATKKQKTEDTYYYDTDDAFNFYHELWGGENIHVGLYDKTLKAEPATCLLAAEKSLEKLHSLQAEAMGGEKPRAIDMGSAYGGCARSMAKRFGCEVVCIDLSEKENAVNIARSKAQKLDHLVTVPGQKSFTETGEKAASFDLVTSQDSFLHAGKYRSDAMKEAARLLKPGGFFVFSDIMQADGVDTAKLASVYKRLELDDMGSPAKYIDWCCGHGLRLISFEDYTPHMVHHYQTMLSILLSKQATLKAQGKISEKYIQNMLVGLEHWVKQGTAGNLCYGYFVFTKGLDLNRGL